MVREGTENFRVTDILKPAVILVIWHFNGEAEASDGKPQSDRCFETCCNSGYLVF
jgi:hypothetical protein